MLDPIDHLEAGWAAELPELDTATMAVAARVNRTSALLNARVKAQLIDAGSSLAEFDVLSALRRSGKPYEMKPSALAKAIMLSPSGMTHRVDQLESAGLLERVPDPTSRRTAPVRLTPTGVESAERLARHVVSCEQDFLAVLTAAEHKQLNRLLRKVSSATP